MRKSRAIILALSFSLFSSGLASAQGSEEARYSWCGTHRLRAVEELAELRYSERLREREQESLAMPKAAPVVSRSGDIAIIEDADGTLITPSRHFDLENRAIQFVPRPRGFVAAESPLGLHPIVGQRLDLADDGSSEVAFPEGFEFPFYGKTYTSVFVNANGNLTFEEGDDTLFGSMNRMLVGPPRIAALMTNLDPSSASGDGGVYVRLTRTRVRITWRRVPLHVFGTEVTMQVTLFRTGRVVIAYGDVAVKAGAVGVSPGRGTEEIEIVDLDSELPFPPRPGAVVEVFRLSQISTSQLAALFAQSYQDVYSHVVFWLDFDANIGALAFQLTIKNEIEGLGLDTFDMSDGFRTGDNLSFIQMGPLSQYPDDPDEKFFLENTAINVLAHEVEHLWGAFARFVDPSGAVNDKLLADDLVHWSFFHDTDGSPLGGHDIVDHGNGTFTTTAAGTHYGPLDQYLMGLLPPQEVPDFFYVERPGPRPALSENGVTFSGRRVDVSVEDVVAANGPRIPSSGESPRLFRTAFVLVTRQGGPSMASLAKVERFRQRWITYFREATDFRAEVDTTLLDL